MFIKAWNSYDLGVYRINQLKKDKAVKKYLEEIFPQKELKTIKRIAREFAEALGVEFVHNLKRGWENKLLAKGRVFSRGGTELKTKEEIKEHLSLNGEIKFQAFRKNGSIAVVKALKRPAHLCWD
jgi:hypothetical protein